MTTAQVAEREGYTVPAAGPSARSRLWRLRWVIGISLAFILLLALTLTRITPASTADLSTWNPKPNGSMAVAEILRDQGVRVSEVDYLSRIHAAEPEATTLVITLPGALSTHQVDSILGYPGDIVFLGTSRGLVSALDAGLEYRDTVAGRFPARCSDPDATVANATTASGPRVRAGDTGAATVCFGDLDGYGTYAVLDRDGRRIILLTDPVIAMNDELTLEGNATLVLRALGKHPNLIWYAGAFDDTTTYVTPGAPGAPPPKGVDVKPGFLPAGAGETLFALYLAGAVAAFWKGRRMGPLVTEPLPIVVHASESTRGRGRLYRRARAYGRASAALRAAAAERMGRRLGIPRSTDAVALVAAVSRASSRDPQGVERLLYGPPPSDESDMMALVKELDTLEREVQRP